MTKIKYKKIHKNIFLFRIEVEEVIAYSNFDQNQDGLVSQDEIYVSKIHK